ncbi:MAG: hypothetical protein R2715_21785 [Ilumatobacteraceae bacterium]
MQACLPGLGRPTDALRHLNEFRTHLLDGYGTAPGAEIQEPSGPAGRDGGRAASPTAGDGPCHAGLVLDNVSLP